MSAEEVVIGVLGVKLLCVLLFVAVMNSVRWQAGNNNTFLCSLLSVIKKYFIGRTTTK